MKIRSGFVSNSSSTSFIIKDRTLASLQLIDKEAVLRYRYEQDRKYIYDTFEEFLEAEGETFYVEDFTKILRYIAYHNYINFDDNQLVQGWYDFIATVIFKEHIISQHEADSWKANIAFQGENEWRDYFDKLDKNKIVENYTSTPIVEDPDFWE